VSESLVLIVPLLILLIVFLFSFAGCTGEDPELAAEQEKREQAERDLQNERDQTAAAREAAKYDHVVSGTAHLVAYWRLSEGETGQTDAVDSGPSHLNGQYKNAGGGGVSRAVPGVLSLVNDPTDKASEFDGTQGHVEVPYNGVLNPPLNFSVELWLRPGGSVTQPEVVYSACEIDPSGNVVRGLVLDVIPNTTSTAPDIRIRLGNGGAFRSLAASLEGGTEHDAWRHVVVTYSAVGNVLRIYVNSDNGSADAELPSPTDPMPVLYVPNPTFPLRIAAGQVEQPVPSTTPALFFKGRIDEVALYNDALPGTTVREHFRAATTVIS
jgi:concanavalin A-like lectin/glucanase superfamily protein